MSQKIALVGLARFLQIVWTEAEDALPWKYRRGGGVGGPRVVLGGKGRVGKGLAMVWWIG